MVAGPFLFMALVALAPCCLCVRFRQPGQVVQCPGGRCHSLQASREYQGEASVADSPWEHQRSLSVAHSEQAGRLRILLVSGVEERRAHRSAAVDRPV